MLFLNVGYGGYIGGEAGLQCGADRSQAACCRRGEFQEAAVYCDEGFRLEPENQRLNSQRFFIHETLNR